MMMMKFIITLALVALAATVVNGFGSFGNKAKRSAQIKSSPLLDDAIASYPYTFKSDEQKAGCIENFNELSRLYGDEGALQIVKIMPKSLTIKREYFAPCLDNWEEQFGLEKAQAMVLRNPGLLAVKPDETDSAESSMAFSYLVAVTRGPIPKIIFAIAVFVAFSPEFVDQRLLNAQGF